MKFSDYINEKKKDSELSSLEWQDKQYRARKKTENKSGQTEKIAKELINSFIKGNSSGDIQSAVEDTAAANGFNVEDFFEVVMKVAKKMGVQDKI